MGDLVTSPLRYRECVLSAPVFPWARRTELCLPPAVWTCQQFVWVKLKPHIIHCLPVVWSVQSGKLKLLFFLALNFKHLHAKSRL